ncbi:MAG: GAF domain-containing protein [Synechococcales bacterium]|nr:GAF domain-containing protein [Synechococcales bacterium]
MSTSHSEPLAFYRRLATQAMPVTSQDIILLLADLSRMMTDLQRVTENLQNKRNELSQHCQLLSKSHRSYQMLFEQAPVGYIVTNAIGVIEQVNDVGVRLLQRTKDTLIGQPLQRLVSERSSIALANFLAQCLSQSDDIARQMEVCLPGSEGREARVNLFVSPIYRQSREISGFRWILHDITERWQAIAFLQQRIDQERQLRKIAHSIRRSLNPQEILQSTVTELQPLLQAGQVFAYRLASAAEPTQMQDPGDSATRGQAGGNLLKAEATDASWSGKGLFPVGDRLLREQIQQLMHHQCLAIDDLNHACLLPDLRAAWQQQQVEAVLVVPLVWSEEPIGLLGILQQSPCYWHPADIELICQLADEVSIALHHADLYHQIQQLNTDLEAEVERRTVQVRTAAEFESMLKRITDKVRDSLDESQILQTAMRELAQVLELGGCNTALYDLEEQTSTISHEYTNFIPAYRGRVAQMNDFPEIYNQLRQGQYFQFCSLIPNPARGQVALLACPIFVDSESSAEGTQQVLGDLWLINHKDHIFNEFEIRLVQQVANQCAIAIRQARLYQAAQGQVHELERLNRLKDEFLSTVSHELRTPISNVKMAIHMLKRASTEEKRQRYFEILEAECQREADLINDLLDLQKLEVSSYPITVNTIALQDWIPSVVEPFQSRISTYQQHLNVICPQSLPLLCTDFDILQRILAELLNNACKYTPSDRTIELSVYSNEVVEDPLGRSLPPGITVIARNQAEIPASELPHIFEKFYRVPNADPWKQGGTGLGLALVQKLVEQLGGSIYVESKDGWTTFTVTVPNLPKQDPRLTIESLSQ